MYGGREALVPVLAQEVVVGRGQELGRRQRTEQPAERAGEEQCAGAGLLALAGHVDDDELHPVVPRGLLATTKSPANGVPPAERSAGLDQPAVGQRRASRPG